MAAQLAAARDALLERGLMRLRPHLALTLAASLLFSTHAYAARTVVVDTEGGDFTSLGEASRAASSGDTVIIRNTVETQFMEDASQGQNKSFFKDGVSYVYQGTTGLKLALKGRKGVRLSGFFSNPFQLSFLVIEDSTDIVVEDCRGDVDGFPIAVMRSRGVRVRNCSLASTSHSALTIGDSKDVVVEGNLIRESQNGVVILDSEVTIRKNTIAGNRVITSSRLGTLAGETGALLRDIDGSGVLVQRCRGTVTVAENILAQNRIAIMAKSGCSVKVRHNAWHGSKDRDYAEFKVVETGSEKFYEVNDLSRERRVLAARNVAADPMFNKPDDLDFSLASGSPALTAGEDGGAIGASDPSAIGAPARYSALLYRGLRRSQDGELEKAVEDLTRAIEIQESSYGHYVRGNIWFDRGALAKALADYERSIGLDERFGKAYGGRGLCRYTSGDYAGARQDYQKACALGYKPFCMALAADPAALPEKGRAAPPKVVPLFPVPISSKVGFINPRRKQVVGAAFDGADGFKDGMAMVIQGRKRGYLDATGKAGIKPQFSVAMDFSEGLARVCAGDIGDCPACDPQRKYGFIDRTGRFVIEPRAGLCNSTGNQGSFSDGLAAVRLGESGREKQGFIDRKGKVVIAARFLVAGDFSDGLAWVSVDGKKGFIGKSGGMVIPPTFADVGPFRAGLAGFKKDGKWGYIDKTGKVVIRPQFDSITWFDDEDLAAVKTGAGWMLIDKTGKTLAQVAGVDAVEGFIDGMSRVMVGNKQNFVFKSGKKAFNRDFEDAKSFSNGLAPIKLDGNWVYIDKLGRLLNELVTD